MNILTVIINFQTPGLLKEAVSTFTKTYPDQDVLIVDNGSQDNSRETIQEIEETSSRIKTLFLENNIFHGPAMDLVLNKSSNYDYLFFLDSDTETRKTGFLEAMYEIAEKDDNVYAIGQKAWVNKRGFKDEQGFQIILTPYMFLRRALYSYFPPFFHHGQPTLQNFFEATDNGYKLVNFPIEKYIFHHWRGTAKKYGYKLGLKGKIDYLLNKFGF